ncbi:MAG: hypothetical protein ACRDMV_01630 [Streptosporangiales bacterium]
MTTPDTDRVVELLEICDELLRYADCVTRAELDHTLLARGITGGPDWLIDTLGLTALQLRTSQEDPDE